MCSRQQRCDSRVQELRHSQPLAQRWSAANTKDRAPSDPDAKAIKAVCVWVQCFIPRKSQSPSKHMVSPSPWVSKAYLSCRNPHWGLHWAIFHSRYFLFAFCNGNLSHLLRFPFQWLFLCPLLIHHLLQAPGEIRGALLPCAADLQALLPLQLLAHSDPSSLWSLLTCSSFERPSYKAGRRSQIQIKADFPRCFPTHPACSLLQGCSRCFPLLFVRGANEFTTAIPSGEGMGTVAQSLWRA